MEVRTVDGKVISDRTHNKTIITNSSWLIRGFDCSNSSPMKGLSSSVKLERVHDVRIGVFSWWNEIV